MNAVLLAIGAGLCWGVGELFTKSVLHTGKVGPITAICVRSTVALPALWAAYLIFVQWKGVEPRDWTGAGAPTLLKLTLGSGLVAGALAMLFFYAALNLGEVSRIKPIAFALAPALAVVLGWLILHEPMSVRKGVAIVLIVVGVILLSSSPRPPTP